MYSLILQLSLLTTLSLQITASDLKTENGFKQCFNVKRSALREGELPEYNSLNIESLYE